MSQFVWKHKRFQVAKAILRKKKELEESTVQTSDNTTKLQTSRQHGTGTRTEIQTNGTKQKAQGQIHAPMDTLSLTKEAEIYNGGKTVSSSDAGNTGHVKKWNQNTY